ncbi:MAG: hypothetical protein ABEJ58_08160 [Halodesulfurarchaeum sp.]
MSTNYLPVETGENRESEREREIGRNRENQTHEERNQESREYGTRKCWAGEREREKEEKRRNWRDEKQENGTPFFDCRRN